MRAAWLLAAVLLAGCPRPAPPPAPPPPLRLVVVIVVDQLPAWTFARDSARFRGGFARLLRDGAVVPAADIPYANTFTAPGHAAIATGAAPSATGIVGNAWFRRADGAERAAEYDPDALPFVVGPALGKGGVSSDLGASARALRVDGVADVLRRSGTGAHSVAISFKARSACLVAGRHPDLAVWFEPAAGGMTTSRAYTDAAPAWLETLAKSGSAARYLGARWEPRDPEMLATATGVTDDSPGEGSDHGMGPTFPHALAATKEPEHAIAVTPFADEIEMDTVAAAIDGMQLGRDDVTDLLAVSFSAHDLAGHMWGPDSWEELDLTLRLDDALGRLFDTLDHRLGKDRWAVVLTSDHGVTPLVERAHVEGARRISPAEIEKAAEQAIEAKLGKKGPWIAKLSSDNLYATHELSELPADERAAGLDAAVEAISAIPQIAGAFRTDTVCQSKVALAPAACLSVVGNEAGEWVVFPAAGSTITTFPAGTAHDAPFDDNRKVPILVMAPGLRPQRGTGSLLQVAPTVAALLGVSPPEAATMPPLFNLAVATPRTTTPEPAR